MNEIEIVYDHRIERYVIWVWYGKYCCERKGERKTLTGARNYAKKFGRVIFEGEI